MRAALVWALVAGCSGSPAAPPANRPSPDDGTGPATPADVEPPTPELLASIGRGEPPLASLIDPAAGLRYATYFTDPSEQDPRADDTGLVKAAELACGDRIAELAADLARELGGDGEPWRCRGWRCERAAPGEYGLDSRYTFAAKAGALRLVEVVQIEGGPVTEAFVADGRRWTADALEALPAACP